MRTKQGFRIFQSDIQTGELCSPFFCGPNFKRGIWYHYTYSGLKKARGAGNGWRYVATYQEAYRYLQNVFHIQAEMGLHLVSKKYAWFTIQEVFVRKVKQMSFSELDVLVQIAEFMLIPTSGRIVNLEWSNVELSMIKSWKGEH